MRLIRICSLMVFGIPAFAADTADSQLTQALLTEIRGLRNDLQTMAATIQRVQMVMFRVQLETGVLDRARQRADQARNKCSQADSLQAQMAVQIEQAETKIRNAQNPAEQRQSEEMLGHFKSQAAMWAKQKQDCQPEQTDAESELQKEHARMSDLQEQLDKLDKLLAGAGSAR